MWGETEAKGVVPACFLLVLVLLLNVHYFFTAIVVA